ncbi:TPA: hypothetical protein ACH3X3_012958 [Trebouxia sp. C0006]
MGAYLSQPVTDKEGEEEENADFKYGVCAMQGWRTEMEDAHLAALNVDNKCSVFGVFDGHGGREVARYVSMYLTNELVQTQAYQQGNTKEALVQVFLRLDEMLSQESVQDELQALAGPKTHADEEEEMAMLSEENLPELLRKALQAKREEDERNGMLSESGDEEHYEDGVTSGPELSSSEDTGAHNARPVEWKSTADSVPNHKSASLSKESIVPQRSQAVHDQPTLDDAHDKGSGLPSKRPYSPSSECTSPNPPPATSPPMPVGRRSKAKAKAQIKRKKYAAFAEPSDEELSDSPPPESIEKAEPLQGAAGTYKGPSAGCTAVVALIEGQTLLVANAGDSRCVVSESGKAVAMSYDHKPTDAAEHSRIIKAGGYVLDGRVNGSLNLSRAIGDMEYKQTSHLSAAEQAVTAFPDVRQIQLGSSSEFMILACDGIWDVLNNQQAVDFVRQRLIEGQSVRYISESVCDHCLAKDTGGSGIGCDNMSMMIVVFKKFTQYDKAHKARMAATSMSGQDLYS